MYRELDTVVLTRDLPDDGLREGDLGAVAQVYGGDALEVETTALATLAWVRDKAYAANAQRAFGGAFVGVSTRPLNAASMAYLSVLARTFGGATTDPNRHRSSQGGPLQSIDRFPCAD